MYQAKNSNFPPCIWHFEDILKKRDSKLEEHLKV